MRTNAELQKDVQDAIKWEPLLQAAEIGVIVKDGIVTLTGTVDSYSKKLEAELAAKHVAGVSAVVEKIEIKYVGVWSPKDDSDIAKSVINALRWNWQIPKDKVKVTVEKGWVTLDGELQWNYLKEIAKDTIVHQKGVLGVSNNITIRSLSEDQIEKKDIENALKRNWSIADRDIIVSVSGHKATLSGKVESWYQKEEAGRIAWKAPGVWSVDNELVIDYSYEIVL
ncbi:MAG: BON domain-containing protein [Bacteroidetes bacterium]|nr:BON domain-containing protein [Bacteroidota bacterium]